jgi:hypothetical protein
MADVAIISQIPEPEPEKPEPVIVLNRTMSNGKIRSRLIRSVIDKGSLPRLKRCEDLSLRI